MSLFNFLQRFFNVTRSLYFIEKKKFHQNIKLEKLPLLLDIKTQSAATLGSQYSRLLPSLSNSWSMLPV